MQPAKLYVGIKALIYRDQQLLVLRRSGEQGEYWDLPGGRMNSNESFEDCLHRELSEELPGTTLQAIGRPNKLWKYPRPLADGTELLLIFIEVEATLPTPIQLSSEHVEYRWVTKESTSSLSPLLTDPVIDLLK